MSELFGVYRIESISTGRFYYGSAQDCVKRKSAHLRALRAGKHHSRYLQRVFNKYGEEDIQFRFIKSCATREEAYRIEAKYLKKYWGHPKCMNVGRDVCGGDNLTNNPRREKIIAKRIRTQRKHLAAMTPEERKEKFGKSGSENGMYGKTHTPEVRARLSKVNRVPKPYLRKPKSEEGRRNMAAAAQKRAAAPDYVNPFEGKTHSKETVRRLRKQAKARAAAGVLPSNVVAVRIGKKVYPSASQAAKAMGCVTATILNRVQSKKFPEYSLAN